MFGFAVTSKQQLVSVHLREGITAVVKSRCSTMLAYPSHVSRCFNEDWVQQRVHYCYEEWNKKLWQANGLFSDRDWHVNSKLFVTISCGHPWNYLSYVTAAWLCPNTAVSVQAHGNECTAFTFGTRKSATSRTNQACEDDWIQGIVILCNKSCINVPLSKCCLLLFFTVHCRGV